MAAPSVLVITRDIDVTADLVVRELTRREVAVARLDLADFPQRLTQTCHLAPGRSRWTGAVRGHQRNVDLSAVRAVWYRKPSPFTVTGLSQTEEQWATAEARMGFGGLLTALDARWVNDPARLAVANQKPYQMAVAAGCGLVVPESLLTNDPEQARDFCRSHPEGVIYKPLYGGPGSENGHRVALRADTVTADEITDGVRRTSHLFQVRVPCAYAVRLTIVGRRLFAARIDTPAGVSAVDWRAVHDHLTYTRVDVPDTVAAGLRAVMDRLGLVYAAPDFVVDHQGAWHFIGDLNPNGQWAWITPLRADITAALADELTKDQQ
ncbi:MAG: ATP-grasp ribosomal peptide maturase [Actinophytocola sp.]|uniref:ATP-grasp ribosomal peptide maturase n=1 Tax=Actinophytocola sp. TaxID=1872138 RepID=UPI00132A58F7|nr:ATP-grasp ribosomal peptide maturase [Actinophytocola sp.]MPZ84698.1 ATP-grasp ribosomal peptide maturase [Actinophytocola sp.]